MVVHNSNLTVLLVVKPKGAPVPPYTSMVSGWSGCRTAVWLASCSGISPFISHLVHTAVDRFSSHN